MFALNFYQPAGSYVMALAIQLPAIQLSIPCLEARMVETPKRRFVYPI